MGQPSAPREIRERINALQSEMVTYPAHSPEWTHHRLLIDQYEAILLAAPKSYLTGVNGPELFAPAHERAVVPNRILQSGAKDFR